VFFSLQFYYLTFFFQLDSTFSLSSVNGLTVQRLKYAHPWNQLTEVSQLKIGCHNMKGANCNRIQRLFDVLSDFTLLDFKGFIVTANK
jgi:hypothetical protein